jgi:hypothetical protein
MPAAHHDSLAYYHPEPPPQGFVTVTASPYIHRTRPAGHEAVDVRGLTSFTTCTLYIAALFTPRAPTAMRDTR